MWENRNPFSLFPIKCDESMHNKVLYLLRIITDCCTVIGTFKIWKPSNILNLIIGLISRIWPSWVFRQQVCTWTNCKNASQAHQQVYILFLPDFLNSQKLTDTVVTQYSWLQGPASQASESGRHRRNTRRITVIYPILNAAVIYPILPLVKPN